METLGILIVDDDKILHDLLRKRLGEGYRLYFAEGVHGAMPVLMREQIDIALLDVELGSDLSGLDLLDLIHKRDSSIVCLMTTSDKALGTVQSSVQKGAVGYLRKPYGVDELQIQLEIAKELRKQRVASHHKDEIITNTLGQHSHEILGESASVQSVRRQIDEVARFHGVSVLITGESGTGKELVARAIHRGFGDPKRPFIAINCAAMPASLIESELFGYEKGAFTGADRRKIGCIELADAGDLFLDEVGELPLESQAKLLRVLQEKEFKRVGGTETVRSDFRLICATNRDLKEMVDAKQFRKDLYFRICVYPIALSPLRERLDDLPVLVSGLIAELNRKHGRQVQGADQGFIRRLRSAAWEGNIRELKNVIECVVIRTKARVLTEDDAMLLGAGNAQQTRTSVPEFAAQFLEQHPGVGLPSLLKMVEDEVIRVALAAYPTQARAADALQVSKATLCVKAKHLGIAVDSAGK